ncbi:MAG: MATE family efflux transporter [Symploca sp. SIO1C2]|nr:MATE family efflux transporter [Symploca sp. SIO1C2]
MVPLSGLVDAAFLGHLADIRYLAGVALATVLFNILYRTFKLLRLGTTGPTAQAVGRSDQDAVLLTLLRNSLIALVMGLIILLLQHPFREAGFALLSATPSVKAAALTYYNARIWGAPAVFINFVLIGWFMGREQGRTVLILSAIGSGSNILLDYLLIVYCGWQSFGAGAATAASQYLMLLGGLVFIFLEGWWVKIPTVTSSIFKLDEIKSVTKLNGDLFVARLALAATVSVFTNISSTLGTLILAANTLLIEMVYLAAAFLDGVSFATESLAGNLWGAGIKKQLVPLMQMSGGVSLSIGLGFAAILIVLPDPLFGLLTNHGEVMEEIHHYLLWLIPILGVWSLTLMLQGYFLGLVDGRLIRNSMVNGIVIGFIPAALAAWKFHNNQTIWLALFLFIVVRMIILGIQVPRSLKENEVAIAQNLESID